MTAPGTADGKPGGAPTPILLARVNERVYRVLATGGRHVGMLKLANGAWKFKAIGYEPDGRIVPGGGPLTHRHDTIVSGPDAVELAAALGEVIGDP